MTELATIDWFGRWGTSVFSANTAIFYTLFLNEGFCLFLDSAYAGKSLAPQLLLKQSDTLHTQYTM